MSGGKYAPGHFDGDGCTFPDPGHFAEKDAAPLPHLPTEDSGECSTCGQPWPCDVAVAWEWAHAAFCPRARVVDVCSTHLRPGDRYMHQTSVLPPEVSDS